MRLVTANSVTDFPNCCGIKILSGLDTDNSYTKSEIKSRYNGLLDGVGRLMATTSEQQEEVEEALEEGGWERVKDFTNPNSGNTVTIWTYKYKE